MHKKTMFVWMMLILITLTISLFVSDEKTVYADGIEDEAEDVNLVNIIKIL